MIPKILHVCWLGPDEPSDEFKKCQYSWVNHLLAKGYKIHIWDKSSIEQYGFNDNAFFRYHHTEKQYSVCSDYVRFYALYNEGGFYIDYDVDVVDSFDRVVHLKTYIGKEYGSYPDKDPMFTIDNNNFEAGIMGCEPKHEFAKQMLDYFNSNESEQYSVLPDACSMALNTKFNYKIVNTIKEAEAAEAEGLLPIFNSPRFDRWYEGTDEQDYGICDHHFFKSRIAQL